MSRTVKMGLGDTAVIFRSPTCDEIKVGGIVVSKALGVLKEEKIVLHSRVRWPLCGDSTGCAADLRPLAPRRVGRCVLAGHPRTKLYVVTFLVTGH